MTFELALQTARSRPADQGAMEELARFAQAEGEEERALPLLESAVQKAPAARLWQWKALLERSLDEHEQALRSFSEAARLEPTDASIAHGHARVAMEAGIDARELYQRARHLAPGDGQVLIGYAAALAAAGQPDEGIKELQAGVTGSPRWLQGHEQLAQLLATTGRAGEATDSIEAALARMPKSPLLWGTFLNIQLRRGAYESLDDIVDRAEAAGVQSTEFAVYRGIHAAEFSNETFPEALFEKAPPNADVPLQTWRVRHLLRLGALDALIPLIDHALASNPTMELWAYTSTAWRLAGDQRLEWLEGDERMVSVTDLVDTLPDLALLADGLRSLHLARGEYLDQSVRGGTQTDGPLFSRIDPVIRHLRRAIVNAVERHIAQLPPADPRHPVLGRRRDRRVRFSGSWSVRLRSGGRHSNHIHPLGWFSSALYVALPPKTEGEPADAGWFTLGSPDELLKIDLPPWRKIEPKPGTLVLFPSIMWHGTVPFAEGERLTVAFDVAPPR